MAACGFQPRRCLGRSVRMAAGCPCFAFGGFLRRRGRVVQEGKQMLRTLRLVLVVVAMMYVGVVSFSRNSWVATERCSWSWWCCTWRLQFSPGAPASKRSAAESTCRPMISASRTPGVWRLVGCTDATVSAVKGRAGSEVYFTWVSRVGA